MTPSHLHNFNAGPAALPQEVLQQAAAAILNLDGTGLSILEIPHRNKQFGDLLDEASALVKELCQLGDDYEILWLQGGGRAAFCLFPMNFLHADMQAAYIDSGHWSAAAYESALAFGHAHIVSSSPQNGYKSLPQWPQASNHWSYLHLTSNNTIEGTQWKHWPSSEAPLVVDMSSDILSCPRDYTKCAAFYAVAQKNLGAAGVTLYAIRKDFLGKASKELPGIFSFTEEVKQNSLLNTPPVFAIYVSLLYLRWLKKQGMENIYEANSQKASLLYQEIERNSLFHCPVRQEDRSEMNVVFLGKDPRVEKEFLAYTQEQNIINIAGHRSVGAFRASLYNAITLAQVKHLINVMQQFEVCYK